MSSKTQRLLILTALIAATTAACSATGSRQALSGATPVECVGATLRSAEDVALYAGCEAVSGDLSVTGGELSDLTGLQRIRSVSGTLSIAGNPHLDDLTGLGQLQSVGRLVIAGNPDLDDLAGLSSLSRAGSIVIRDNPELGTLRGLEGIERAEHVSITNNGIYDTKGLSNLREVGELDVVGNPKLISLAGLKNVNRARSVRLQANPRLCASFGLLPELENVDRLVVRSNRGLSTRDVDTLIERVSKAAGSREAALR